MSDLKNVDVKSLLSEISRRSSADPKFRGLALKAVNEGANTLSEAELAGVAGGLGEVIDPDLSPDVPV